MIDKAVVAIQATGLFEAAMGKWHALDAEDQHWLDVKEHFGSAFDIWLTSGADTGCWNSPQRIYPIVPTAQIGSPAGLESTYVQSTDHVHTRVIWVATEAPNKLILIP